MPNIIYNNVTSSWSCCGDTLADCSAPTSETFDAIAPSAFDTLSSVSPAAASSIASSAVASAPSVAADSSSSPNSSGLGHGSIAGIAFGVAIPFVFILAATIGFCLRKRKLRAQRRAQIDHALVEELSGGMRSIDSWYGGPTLHGSSPNSSNLRTLTNGSGGVDTPGHTFAYETSEGPREVKLTEQAATAKKMPLQLQLARLHFSRGHKKADRNTPAGNGSGVIVSPLEETSSPVRHHDGQDLGAVRENPLEEMEGSNGGAGTWPLPTILQRPWEFQRSVVSLREMDGTGVNPLEQRQSGTDEDGCGGVVLNREGTGGSEWQVRRPWQIQKPPSMKDMDGTGKLSLPAVSDFLFLGKV